MWYFLYVSAINTVKNLVAGTDGAKPPEEPGTSGGGEAEPEASTSGEGKIGVNYKLFNP